MPQLKKVVLAMGDRLIYRDTFVEALAELTGGPASPGPAVPAAAPAAARLGGHRDRYCLRLLSASAVFENRPNNWPGSWRRWKKRRGRNRRELPDGPPVMKERKIVWAGLPFFCWRLLLFFLPSLPGRPRQTLASYGRAWRTWFQRGWFELSIATRKCNITLRQ